jgi:hypothetical protein
MSKLEEDLTRYANEVFTKADLKAGWKLVSEILGLITLGGIGITAMTVWIPGLGLPISSGYVAYCMAKLAHSYAHASEEERKQFRAVVKFLSGGIKLID